MGSVTDIYESILGFKSGHVQYTEQSYQWNIALCAAQFPNDPLDIPVGKTNKQTNKTQGHNLSLEPHFPYKQRR